MTRPDHASEADQLPEWHVEVDGCVNFRDAGGWETIEGAMVRRGRLYRSDDPIRITSAGRAAVDRLGLAKVIDLRQQTQFSRTPGFVEVARTAHVPLVDQIVDHKDQPLLDTARDIADVYAAMLAESRDQVGRVLDDPPIARLPERLFRAPAETFELLLGDVFEQHVSLEAWVASFPIADSTIDRLRADLVTPERPTASVQSVTEDELAPVSRPR